MDDIPFLSPTPPPVSHPTLSSISKPTHSPSATLLANSRQRTDSASVIQQADVSSSRPALLAHDALGPLLFEALDGFFFTINRNFELDFISDNVGQYLKFTQEELAGRNLYYCVHPSDVSEFDKAWTKKDAGDPLATATNSEPSRGRTFRCRMRTNDETTPYVNMVVSAALHRDSSGNDKTFLICIARRPPANESKDRPALLGFDQFSSRINLQYDIESFDASHMKCEALNTNFQGKNFRDYVHHHDIPLVLRHFQEVTEKGESKSAVYRFCLRDDIYAFINTQSKLFSNSSTGVSESIMSTHTIVRIIENANDLNGNASTRLVKSIISSNRDLQKNKGSATATPAASTPPLPPTPVSSTPIGTQFALTMLGMHKNPSNSLQQHVSNTLDTLQHVQNSFSTPPTSLNEKTFQQINASSPSRPISQKSSTLDNVSSSETVEFGSKRNPFSPSVGSVQSNQGGLPSPGNSLDIFFSSMSPSNDLNSLFQPLPSPVGHKRLSSPLDMPELNVPSVSSNEIYSTLTSNPSRSSLRLRQLLATKSPSSTATSPLQTFQLSNAFDDLTQRAESPTTTNVSPSALELPSPSRRRRKASQIDATPASMPQPGDMLLKQILGRQPPVSAPLSLANTPDMNTLENNNSFPWPSPASASSNRQESVTNDENNADGQMLSTRSASSSKLRSDTFLRTLLNDEVRPQKVVVEAPFTYGTRHRSNQRASGGAIHLLGPSQNKSLSHSTNSSLKSQLSLDINDASIWDPKSKKKLRQNSHTFGSRSNVMTTLTLPRKPGRPKRDPSDYLLFNPQSTLSDNSLDSLFDSNPTLEQNTSQTSSAVTPRATRQSSTSTNQLKRLADPDESLQNPRKLPRLLSQALKDEVKLECTEHPTISPSTALAATRPVNQVPQTIIKSEPGTFDLLSPFDKMIASKRSLPAVPTPATTQSPLLRSLIRTPQNPSITAKKDAPLYDLLQNLEANDTSIFSTLNATPPKKPSSASVDALEQYLSPSVSQSAKAPTPKDNYLAALLSADPQKPSEISFIPAQKQQQQQPLPPTLARSTSNSSESSRIAAIFNDLYNSTSAAQTTPTHTTTSTTSNINDDFLSLLDNKDFLECLTDSSTIDSILSENSTSVIQPSFASSVPKHSEKDEKAISEIYKTLVTSFNPGPTSLDLPLDNTPFSSITGDFLFSDANPNSVPPNRTVNMDPMMSNYRVQPTSTYSYQPQQQQQSSSNTSQFSDGLSMDMMDNSNLFPPNVTLSPINNNFLPSTNSSHLDNNPMMMYPQQTPQHLQHHSVPNQGPTHYFRPAPQSQQANMYNNYGPPPPNQVAPGYYPMQQQQQQQRTSPANHSSPMSKRPALMHSPRTAQQTNQQLQLHMSMNVTLPHMQPNQQQQQQQQPQQHRPMMTTYNDLMMSNGAGSSIPQDFHQYSSPMMGNNPLDLPYNHDLFMSPSPSTQQQQQQQQSLSHQRHVSAMQQQQPYSNMNVPLSATIQQQQNSHNSNNLTNPSMANLTPMECRQSDELNNTMMNCLSFQPVRCTSEFVRKQLQNTIQGRQKPAGNKDVPVGAAGHKMMSATANLDPNQKGAYFRSQLSSPVSTPPLQTGIRSQQQQQSQQGKTTM